MIERFGTKPTLKDQFGEIKSSEHGEGQVTKWRDELKQLENTRKDLQRQFDKVKDGSSEGEIRMIGNIMSRLRAADEDIQGLRVRLASEKVSARTREKAGGMLGKVNFRRWGLAALAAVGIAGWFGQKDSNNEAVEREPRSISQPEYGEPRVASPATESSQEGRLENPLGAAEETAPAKYVVKDGDNLSHILKREFKKISGLPKDLQDKVVAVVVEDIRKNIGEVLTPNPEIPGKRTVDLIYPKDEVDRVKMDRKIEAAVESALL